jgi:hypothetical protein
VIPIGGSAQHVVAQVWGDTLLIVATPAGEIQPYLRQSRLTIFAKLADLIRINRHQVSPNVAGELLGVTPGRLGDTRQVTINAGYLELYVAVHVLGLSLLEVAVFTLGPGRL